MGERNNTQKFHGIVGKKASTNNSYCVNIYPLSGRDSINNRTIISSQRHPVIHSPKFGQKDKNTRKNSNTQSLNQTSYESHKMQSQQWAKYQNNLMRDSLNSNRQMPLEVKFETTFSNP